MQTALVGTVASFGIYFWWYRYFKNQMTKITGRKSFSNVEMTIITAGAGVLSSVFSNPIWMVNTRLSILKKEDGRVSTMRLIKDIYKNEGLSAFFKGVLPNLILVINPIINFVIYESLKRLAIKRYGSERKIPFSAIFVMSSIGKMVATLVTYPILTIKVKLQADSTKDSDKVEEPQEEYQQGLRGLIKKLTDKFYQIGGIIGLYKGLEAKMVQTLLYNALMMAIYEKLRAFVKAVLFKAVYRAAA